MPLQISILQQTSLQKKNPLTYYTQSSPFSNLLNSTSIVRLFPRGQKENCGDGSANLYKFQITASSGVHRAHPKNTWTRGVESCARALWRRRLLRVFNTEFATHANCLRHLFRLIVPHLVGFWVGFFLKSLDFVVLFLGYCGFLWIFCGFWCRNFFVDLHRSWEFYLCLRLGFLYWFMNWIFWYFL